MTYEYKLKNVFKGILTVALLSTMTAGCGKKADEESGKDTDQKVSETEKYEKPEGIQEADSAVIGSDGSIKVIEEAGQMQEALPSEIQEMPISETENSGEAVTGEETTDPQGESQNTEEGNTEAGEQTGGNESGEQGTEGSETETGDENSKETGGF